MPSAVFSIGEICQHIRWNSRDGQDEKIAERKCISKRANHQFIIKEEDAVEDAGLKVTCPSSTSKE